MPHVRSVSFGVWIKAGSFTDTPAGSGLSHFLEHMLFKGTGSRTAYDIASSIESIGGSLNAFTSRNLTCYHATVLGEDISKAVDVILDMLQDPLFRKEDIETEKKVVAEEIFESRDVPEDFIQDEFADRVLTPLPESNSILGSEHLIREITADDLHRYRTSHYRTDTIVMAAVGNVDHTALVELIQEREKFSRDAQDKASPYVSERQAEQSVKIHHGLTQAHLCHGARIFGYPESRRLTLLLLHTILGDGMSSRLFQNIREHRGLAYSVYTYFELYERTGLFATYAATDAKYIDVTLELINKEYDNICKHPLNDTALSRLKNQLKGSLLIGLESPYNRMSYLAKQYLYKSKYSDINDTIMKIDRITAEEISVLAQEILDDEINYDVILT